MKILAKLIILTILFMSHRHGFGAVDIQGSAHFLRGQISQKIFLNLTLKEASVTDFPTADTNQHTRSVLNIYFDSNTTLPIAFQNGSNQQNASYFPGYLAKIVESSKVNQENNDETVTVKIKIDILENNPNQSILQMFEDNEKNTLDLKITYTGTDSEEENIAVVRKFSAVDESPQITGLSTGFAQLSVSWNESQFVKYTDETLNDQEPLGVSIILVRGDMGITSLDGKAFDKNEENETSSPCSFAFTDNTNCTISCEPNTYLDLDSLTNSEGIKTATIRYPVNNYVFQNLENDIYYGMIAMYEPDGLQQSACLTGTPQANISFVELSGGQKAKAGNPACFIASAAFGSPLATEVQHFRWFRDHFLLNTSWGRALINEYYDRSPPFAQMIRQNEILASGIRLILWPLLCLITILRYAPGWMLIFLCLSLFFIFLKRRHIDAKS